VWISFFFVKEINIQEEGCLEMRHGAHAVARKTPKALIRLVGALIQDQHCVSCRSTDNPRCTLRLARQAINHARNSTPQARHAAQRNVILERYSET
jgi:hypothetical protein